MAKQTLQVIKDLEMERLSGLSREDQGNHKSSYKKKAGVSESKKEK